MSGVIAAEFRGFFERPADRRQFEDYNFSGYLQPEFFHQWDEDRQRLVFVPFFRYDQHDSRRTHGDVRELAWNYIGDDWEVRLGARKVFWGVTEVAHLVDIINQTDLVENIDTEDKLGQPMLNLSIVRDWGTLDLFVLPYFREETFPATNGRLRFQLPIKTSLTRFDSTSENWHVDFAAHWFHAFGDLELGLSHFYGTGREPRLIPVLHEGDLVLAPRYDLIHQTGLTAQYVSGDWLWKLEAIRRQGNGETFYAVTGGFEYTLVGIQDTAMDLGLIGEYIWDGRSDEAPPQPFKNDIVLGFRLAVNDAASSQVLFTYTQDLEKTSRFFNLEASRRIGESFKLSLEARFFVDVDRSNPLFGARKDDHVQLELGWYF